MGKGLQATVKLCFTPEEMCYTYNIDLIFEISMIHDVIMILGRKIR